MAIGFKLNKTERVLFCASKWWGDPDFPEQMEYPTVTVTDEDGETYDYPLTFICQINCEDIAPFDPQRPQLPQAVTDEVQIQVKYAGYLARQEKQVAEFKKEEERRLPEDIDYSTIVGLRLEAQEKLQQIRPVSIGQAGRISGVSPADIAVLLIYLEQR